MKRWILPITASVIVGIICTIGTSWYVASKEIPNVFFVFLSSSPKQIPDEAWMWPTDSSWPTHPHELHPGNQSRTFSITTQTAYKEHREENYGHRVNYTLTRYTFGWPFKAMSSFNASRHIVYDRIANDPSKPQGSLWYESIAHGIKLPYLLKEFDSVNYPLVPTHLGFVLNTAIYGFAAFAIISAPRFISYLRNWNRTKSGHFLKCGYDLAGLETCPECNTPAPQKAAVT